MSWIDRDKAIWRWFQNLLTKRLAKKFNVILLVCGQAGIGKSYASMTLCEEMDKEFNIDRVVFTPQQVMKQVKKLSPKSWLVIDEPALSGILSKRSWMDDIQNALIDCIETFRFMNLGVCFNTISSQLLDKTVRELLCHYMIVMLDRGYGRVYAIQPSQFTPKTRTPYLGDAYFEMPSKELYHSYEKKRAKFIKSRYNRSITEMHAKESTHLTFKTLVEEAKEIIDKLRIDGEVNVAEIQYHLGCGKARAYSIKNKLKTLGYA